MTICDLLLIVVELARTHPDAAVQDILGDPVLEVGYDAFEDAIVVRS